MFMISLKNCVHYCYSCYTHLENQTSGLYKYYVDQFYFYTYDQRQLSNTDLFKSLMVCTLLTVNNTIQDFFSDKKYTISFKKGTTQIENRIFFLRKPVLIAF